MELEHYTDNWLYKMQQTSAYCMEKGEQFLKNINAGITMDQFITLDILSVQQGLCQMDLAKAILKDRVFTSRMINTLEDKGLAERRSETKGKRLVNRIYLTKEGEKIHAEVQQELAEKYNEAFEEITDEELKTIKQGIEKLKNCISKATIMPL